jgi:hypothetical protein
MRRASILIPFGLLLVAACAASPAGEPHASAASATLFEGARLIAGGETAPIEDSAFVVQDGKFTAVGRRGQVQAPSGAARVLTSEATGSCPASSRRTRTWGIGRI